MNKEPTGNGKSVGLTTFSLCCVALTVLALSGAARASIVTVVRGETAREAGARGDAGERAASPGAPGSDTVVLTFGDEKVLIHEAPLGLPGAYVAHHNVRRDNLFLVRDRRAVSQRRGYDVLYSHGGFHLAVVEKPGDLAGIRRLTLRPITGSRVVLEKAHLPKSAPDPLIEKILLELDGASYEAYLSTLSEDMGSRYLCSAEILTARDAIARHFEALGLATHVVKFSGQCWPKRCEGPQGFNVIGIKKGLVRPQKFCVVGGHYDSINEDAPCGSAPGANDNGSGAAGVMELARLFSPLDTETSVVFVAFGGEEQGLLGSKAFVRSLLRGTAPADLKAANLKSFVALDMISYFDRNYGVIVEGASRKLRQRKAVNKLVQLGLTYTDLDIEKTYNYGDSDHEPFLNRGMAGALLIETDWDTYKYYHTAQDLMVYQDIPYAMQVLRLAAAMAATESAASFR
jgi:hypothetical protein